MKLSHGKHATIELEPVLLDSRVEDGIRVFAPRGDESMRAAFVATRAVAQAFVAPADPGAAMTSAAQEEAANRVEMAMFRDPSGSLRVVYHELVLRFEPHATEKSRRALLGRYGLVIRESNRFVADQFVVADEKRHYVAERTVELANELTETEEVAFAFPNFVSEFSRAAVAPMPTPINAQWHLRIVKATGAWKVTRGKAVVVAVLDDGIDVEHPNLKRNIARKPDRAEPRDLLGRDFFLKEDHPDHFNPRPKHFRAPFHEMEGNDIHGTPCAGVIASSGDADGVLGIAPEAKILPVKVFHADRLATETRVANAIRYATRFADVISCSWGGPELGDVENALEEAGAGRGGLGTPVFCATGNENTRVSHPARSKFAIGVGASTDREERADYSNHGPEVSVVAPSDGGTLGIFTTDVSTPNRGFNVGVTGMGGADGLHTNDFGGTSSATPLAAGIAALVLAVHPKLKGDEVRDLLQKTADKIGPASSYKDGHSTDFGFGRVNASKAVAEAEKLARAAKLTVGSAIGRRSADAGAKKAAKRAGARARPAKAKAPKPASAKRPAASRSAARPSKDSARGSRARRRKSGGNARR
jgi:subtilisin family serine protease